MSQGREPFEIRENEIKGKESMAERDKIRAEFERLYRKGTPSEADFADLAKRYPNIENIIDEYQRFRAKRYADIKKKARKWAEKILQKYATGKKTTYEILKKMLKHKAEYNWSDMDYDLFRKELSDLLTGKRAMEIEYNQNLIAYRSRISQALGYKPIREEEGLKIKDTEQGILAEILRMYDRYLALHNQVFMHSLTYEDTSLVAITGEYKREHHIASNYIHPIIACMFIPKFDVFEIHMLYSNFGKIIKDRHERKPIVTEPDALLYYDIISDPNDVVCEVSSPITDIRNRYQVQIHLWETVLKLRNGKYYEATSISEFIASLNACRNNLYDNTDLIYNQDDGAIMRRLMSVFSLRPTFIATKPIYSIASLGQCGLNFLVPQTTTFGTAQGLLPFVSQPVYTITSIPMITLQIPPYQTDDAQPIDLKSAINQTIWINENKTIVPKEQTIIYSKEVLIFYVNRRIQRIQIRTFANPLTFSQLPLTMSSFDRLNKYPLIVPDRISIRSSSDEAFELRSVVAVTETTIRQTGAETSIITGSVGLIATHRNPLQGTFEPNHLLYDPFGASLPVKHPLWGRDAEDAGQCCNPRPYDGFVTNKPFSFINSYISPVIDGIEPSPSFYDRASKNGTIFIYAKPSGYKSNEVLLF